jgi:glucuronokinase
VRPASATASARAALAGNPSDGFGGRTLALELPALEARVTVEPADSSFDVDRALAAGGERALLAAALVRLAKKGSVPPVPPVPPAARRGSVPPAGFDLRCDSSIPPEVGLAGSSAIVVATLRALSDAFELALTPEEIAPMALAAEVEELGIAAGPQDRVVQAHGGLVLMDFGDSDGWRVEQLDPALLPPLFVAWHGGSAKHSGEYHASLRARHAAGDADVTTGLERLAQLALEARDALVAGDYESFARCVDGSFDARAAMGPLDPAHVRLIETARTLGASANYAGSGGAVVGTLPSGRAADELREAFERAGCGFQLTAAPPR